VVKIFACIITVCFAGAFGVAELAHLWSDRKVSSPTWPMEQDEAATQQVIQSGYQSLDAELAPVVSDAQLRVKVINYMIAKIHGLEAASRNAEAEATNRLSVSVVASGSTWVKKR
jgi:hypothetical protein